MNTKRVTFILVILSALIVTVAISSPPSRISPSSAVGAIDFYQRHPAWGGTSLNSQVAASDYYQRHPELVQSAVAAADLTDYFIRHASPVMEIEASDLSDYFQRHP